MDWEWRSGRLLAGVLVAALVVVVLLAAGTAPPLTGIDNALMAHPLFQVSAAATAFAGTVLGFRGEPPSQPSASRGNTALLRESNRLLLMAEELASLGHWVFDPGRDGLLLSAEAAAMIGAPQLTIAVGDALDLLQPRDRLRLLRTLVAARRVQAPIECTIRLDERQGNRTLQLRMQIQGVGRASSLFGVVSDITAKLEVERQLRLALDEARSAASFRSQFLATMSHEIRTPMTGVIGMIELLEADPAPAERRLYLQTLRQSGDLLMAVLNDILDFSKVDAGRVSIDDQPFDLGDMLLATLRLFDRTAAARGLQLKLDAPPSGAVWLRGDALRLRQVLSNLLSNAIKFSERGEVVLRCDLGAPVKGRRHVRLSVIDQGIGIDPALAARLFEPFVQGHEREASGGTGLGLAISRRLVAAMNGSLDFRSTLGKGSTFTISLPLPLAGAAAGSTDRVRPPTDRSLAILLAEDNEVNQLLITALCKRMGHRVTCADNGERAVALATDRSFDLILMDMQMPRCDGLTAARRIREGHGPNTAVPIVALTADASIATNPHFANAGLDALLTKPIDSHALDRTLGDIGAAWSGDRSLEKAAPAAGRAAETLDPAVLAELRSVLGAARVDQLLALLADELEQRTQALRAAVADRDFAAAAAEAHSLRGAAANLGALGVSQAARACEEAIAAAVNGDPQPLPAVLSHLNDAANKALREVHKQRRLAVVEAVHA